MPISNPALTSRKWKVTQQMLFLIFLIPILFHYIQISDQVTMTVLGALIGVGISYCGWNVMEAKINAP